MPSLSDLTGDRRKLLLTVTGGVVALALVVTVLVVVLGGGSGSDDTPAAPSGPIDLVAPATQEVFTLAGEPAQLAADDLEAALGTVEAYLNAAALEAPLTDPSTTTSAPTDGAPARSDARAQFTDAAAARFETDDRLTLSDAHLGPADGASPQSGSVTAVAGLVGDDGAGQLVVVTVEVTTVVDLDDDVVVTRRGDLVLEKVEGAWRISGYDLAVERAFASETQTTEAAFRA